MKTEQEILNAINDLELNFRVSSQDLLNASSIPLIQSKMPASQENREDFLNKLYEELKNNEELYRNTGSFEEVLGNVVLSKTNSIDNINYNGDYENPSALLTIFNENNEQINIEIGMEIEKRGEIHHSSTKVLGLSLEGEQIKGYQNLTKSNNEATNKKIKEKLGKTYFGFPIAHIVRVLEEGKISDTFIRDKDDPSHDQNKINNFKKILSQALYTTLMKANYFTPKNSEVETQPEVENKEDDPSRQSKLSIG